MMQLSLLSRVMKLGCGIMMPAMLLAMQLVTVVADRDPILDSMDDPHTWHNLNLEIPASRDYLTHKRATETETLRLGTLLFYLASEHRKMPNEVVLIQRPASEPSDSREWPPGVQSQFLKCSYYQMRRPLLGPRRRTRRPFVPDMRCLSAYRQWWRSSADVVVSEYLIAVLKALLVNKFYTTQYRSALKPKCLEWSKAIDRFGHVTPIKMKGNDMSPPTAAETVTYKQWWKKLKVGLADDPYYDNDLIISGKQGIFLTAEPNPLQTSNYPRGESGPFFKWIVKGAHLDFSQVSLMVSDSPHLREFHVMTGPGHWAPPPHWSASGISALHSRRSTFEALVERYDLFSEGAEIRRTIDRRTQRGLVTHPISHEVIKRYPSDMTKIQICTKLRYTLTEGTLSTQSVYMTVKPTVNIFHTQEIPLLDDAGDPLGDWKVGGETIYVVKAKSLFGDPTSSGQSSFKDHLDAAETEVRTKGVVFVPLDPNDLGASPVGQERSRSYQAEMNQKREFYTVSVDEDGYFDRRDV
eukprot:GFYU01006725.1.p1 GENE.GFYU01006725.1~~GFYU01006725.1.p1  ORF type:complete len:524 (-),score=38.73 GFYU01006725.1:297-1868(-)